MPWYFFAFLSPLLWSISNHIDKYILGKYLKDANSGVVAIFAGFVGFFFSLGILIFSPESVFGISTFHAVLIILNGALLVAAFIPYFYALNEEDASAVVPLYQTIPIFSFTLGFILLGESIGLLQIVAGILIILGSVLISVDLSKSGFHFKKRSMFLMLLSSFMISLHYLVFKYVALEESFWRTVFWEYLGAVLVALFLLVFLRRYRTQFIDLMRNNSLGVISINVLNEIINIGAKLFANYASLIIPIVVVNLANGLQPLFVFGIGALLTIFLPSISKEQISRQYVIQRIGAIVILFIGTYLLII